MRRRKSIHSPLFWRKIFRFFLFLNASLLISVSALADLRSESPVVLAVQKVSDAVVNISTEYEIQASRNPFSRFGQDSFFDNFFKDFYEPGLQRNVKRTSLGSGVIIDGSRGYVLTNTHVIAESGTIHVILKDDREIEARIVGADSESDLAVLQVSGRENLPAIEMGNSDNLLIGETVIAIGNPFGFSNTVTTGVISALNRTIQTDEMVYRDFIQTDASINPGNSGGPLLNINGELIGINTAVYANAQGIGFAIPISKARRIVNDLIKYGEVVHAWIGISLAPPDSGLSEDTSHGEKEGVFVKTVFPGSPADKAGIQAGDIIVSLGEKPLFSQENYQAVMKDVPVGERLSVDYQRQSKAFHAKVIPSVFPFDAALDLAQDLFGIRVSEIKRGARGWGQSRLGNGVVITSVTASTYLSKIGVSSGDIIHAIDDMTVSNVEEFKRAVAKNRLKSTAVMLIERNGRLYNVTVKSS